MASNKGKMSTGAIVGVGAAVAAVAGGAWWVTRRLSMGESIIPEGTSSEPPVEVVVETAPNGGGSTVDEVPESSGDFGAMNASIDPAQWSGSESGWRSDKACDDGRMYDAERWSTPAVVRGALFKLGIASDPSGDPTPNENRRFQAGANETRIFEALGDKPLAVDGVMGPCTLRALSVAMQYFGGD